MDDIKLAASFEEMWQMDAWKWLDKWLIGKRGEATTALAKNRFTSLDEVRALQERVNLIDMLYGEIKNRVDRGKVLRAEEGWLIDGNIR